MKYPGPVSGLWSKQTGWVPREKTADVIGGDIAHRTVDGQNHAGLCISKTKVVSALNRLKGVKEENVTDYDYFGYLGCIDK